MKSAIVAAALACIFSFELLAKTHSDFEHLRWAAKAARTLRYNKPMSTDEQKRWAKLGKQAIVDELMSGPSRFPIAIFSPTELPE